MGANAAAISSLMIPKNKRKCLIMNLVELLFLLFRIVAMRWQALVVFEVNDETPTLTPTTREVFRFT